MLFRLVYSPYSRLTEASSNIAARRNKAAASGLQSFAAAMPQRPWLHFRFKAESAMREHECCSYVEHLIAEHRRIHRMLRLAHHTIIGAQGSQQDAPPAVVVRVLQQVREELEHHFAQEESGGCLHEAVSRCPPLSAEAHRIEAEHRELLQDVDRLIAQALDTDRS